MRATIRDVARLAGLSTSTVSRVLTGNPHVSEETRGKVEQAVAEVGYLPNGLARGLIQKRRNVIAVIIPEGYNPYYDDINLGVNQVAAENGLSVIAISQIDSATHNMVQRILEIGVDGVLHLGSMVGDSVVPLLVKTETPFVLLCRQRSDVSADTLLFDDFSSGMKATEHLLAMGHRDIAYIYGSQASLSSAEKCRGYTAALSAGGIPVNRALIRYGELRIDVARRAMETLLDERASGGISFTAVLAGNDLMAFGAREAIMSRGLRIPDDISLIGMDDIFWCGIQGVDMTSIRVPRLEIGRLAAKLLIARINNPEKKTEMHILGTELISRKSCSPPKETNQL